MNSKLVAHYVFSAQPSNCRLTISLNWLTDFFLFLGSTNYVHVHVCNYYDKWNICTCTCIPVSSTGQEVVYRYLVVTLVTTIATASQHILSQILLIVDLLTLEDDKATLYIEQTHNNVLVYSS